MARVKAIRDFWDKKARVNRKANEEFEATAQRISELNACGVEQCFAPLVKELSEPRKSGRPTKAELLAEAEEKGVEVPEGATNPEIAALVGKRKA